MKAFFEYISTHLDLAAIVSATMTVIISIYISKSTPNYELIRERYDKLIHPLWQLLEPVLYIHVNNDIIEKAIVLIDSNSDLAGGPLLSCSYFCKISKSQTNYNKLCTTISKEYDKACSQLHIGKRPIFYRVIRNQYKSKYAIFVYIVIQTLAFFPLVLAGLFLLTFIVTFILSSLGII